MTSSTLHRIAVFALTVAMALPIAPRELVVLCLGADGHVAVESASDACRDVVDASDSGGATYCSDGCGPCQDVRLITGAQASGRPSNDFSLPGSLSLVALPAWSLCLARVDSPRRHASALSHPRADTGISSRSLIALLI